MPDPLNFSVPKAVRISAAPLPCLALPSAPAYILMLSRHRRRLTRSSDSITPICAKLNSNQSSSIPTNTDRADPRKACSNHEHQTRYRDLQQSSSLVSLLQPRCQLLRCWTRYRLLQLVSASQAFLLANTNHSSSI